MNITVDTFYLDETSVTVQDGDNLVSLKITFDADTNWIDTSFDHAYGTHHDGYWDFEMKDPVITVIESDGRPIDYDNERVLDAIYAYFDEHYSHYAKTIENHCAYLADNY